MRKQIISLILFFFINFAAVASGLGFLQYAVISDFTESDIQQLQDEYELTLNSKKPGEVHVWKNNNTGNGGEISVIKNFKQQAYPCKRLKFKNQSKNQSATSYFNFCLIDSKWKVVNK